VEAGSGTSRRIELQSIVPLEREKDPRNPLIHAVRWSHRCLSRSSCATIVDIAEFSGRRAGDPTVSVDPEVADSEAQTDFRNAARHFLLAFDNLQNLCRGAGDVLQPVQPCGCMFCPRALADCSSPCGIYPHSRETVH